MHSEPRYRAPVRGGFGLPLGVALGIVVTFAAVAAGATGHPERAVIGLAVAVALTAGLTTVAATLGTAVICWFLLAGFVVGREGQVSFAAQSDRAAAVLAGTAIGCAAVVALIRWAWPRLRATTGVPTAPSPRQADEPARLPALVLPEPARARVRENS